MIFSYSGKMAFSGKRSQEAPAGLTRGLLTEVSLPGITLDSTDLPLLRLTAGKQTFSFWVEYRRFSTPQQLEQARVQAQRMAQERKGEPLVLVPYLSEERLLGLESAGISGLDLCGNGVLTVPGRLYVFRTGFPNRFRSGTPLKNAFRGASSLVARAFLLQPEYASVGQVHREIVSRGGALTLGTVSKALKELEAELLVGRASGTLRLLEPERLLERLEREFQPPKVTARMRVKVELDFEALRGRGIQVIRTGIGSATHYATLAMENILQVYTPSQERLIEAVELEGVPEPRFFNLEVLETADPTAYFDARPDGFASPLQTYLEMRASGDDRLRQSALQVREKLLTP
jgi:hypothetical protein